MSELQPITRTDKILAHMIGMSETMPEPITREDKLLAEVCKCVKSAASYPKDSEGNPDYGEIGQFLTSNGEGGTEWTDMPCAAVWKASIKGILEANVAQPLLPSDLEAINSRAFYGNDLISYTSLPDAIKTLGAGAFYLCRSLALTKLPQSLQSIKSSCFKGCTALTEITFQSTPTIAGSAFEDCVNLTTINVPWDEGEVPDAPWGALNATINYNVV